jgi:hypothetical protein
MPSVTVNFPNSPAGAVIEVAGLGEFENGGTYDVTDEQVQTFLAVQGKEEWEDLLVVQDLEAAPGPGSLSVDATETATSTADAPDPSPVAASSDTPAPDPTPEVTA